MHELPTDALTLALLAFVLGLRHGLDADHLATVDGLTRHNSARGKPGARWCGVLFSLGHGVVVLAVAVGVTTLTRRGAVPQWADDFGAWVSISFLTALGLLNIRSALATPRDELVRPVTLKGRWLGGLQRASHPVAVAAVGSIFALSFDTLSQAALFAATGARGGGSAPAAALALLFTAGMLVADGANGWWVAHLVRRADATPTRASRALAWTVGGLSLAVAAWGLARRVSPGVAQWGDGKELLLGLMAMASVATGYLLVMRRMRSPIPGR